MRPGDQARAIALCLAVVVAAGTIPEAGRAEAGATPEKQPATKAAARVMETVALVEQKLTSTRYQHKTVVVLKKGIFWWDCSGMVAWVLGRAAPKARKALAGEHPLAKHFHKVIASAPAEAGAAGAAGADGKKAEPKAWTRLGGPGDIAPGDLFAWLKPEFWKLHKNTGHVGFVVGTPWPHPDHPGVWLMRVADASRYLHEGDTKPGGGVGGFGTGIMAYAFAEDGTALAYGWHGSGQDPQTYVPTSIVFGRVAR